MRIPESDQAVQFPVDVVMEKNYVDEVMCFMQGASKEAAIVRLGPVSMRMGVAGSCIAKPGKRLYALGDRKTEGQELIVAKVIEFYIPSNFHKRARWIPTFVRRFNHSSALTARSKAACITKPAPLT